MDVANPKEIFFADGSRGAGFKMVFVQISEHDGIDGACLLTIAAVNTLKEIDVVASGATGAVIAFFGLYGDGQRRAHGFAQLAGDTPFLAIGIAAQRMQSAKTGRFRGLLIRVLNRKFLAEEVAAGYR